MPNSPPYKNMPIYKDKSNPTARAILCALFAILSPSLATYGGLLMGGGSTLAAWLIATSAVLLLGSLLSIAGVWETISSHLKKRWQQVMIVMIIGILFFVPVFIVFNNKASNERTRLSNINIGNGQLIPGNGPDPVPQGAYMVTIDTPPYTIPSSNLTVMLGDKVGVFMRRDQKDIIELQGEPIVSIWLDENGRMLLSAKIYDKNNNQILKIVGNEFYGNPLLSTFDIERPNYHTLTVVSKGAEVLSVDYINPNAIRISGKFYLKGYSEPFVITPDSNINFLGLRVTKTKPFMFNLLVNPNPFFIDVIDAEHISLGGFVFGGDDLGARIFDENSFR